MHDRDTQIDMDDAPAPEFVFEQDSSNAGTLTYRGMSFSIICEADEPDESQFRFLDAMTACLNTHFKDDINS